VTDKVLWPNAGTQHAPNVGGAEVCPDCRGRKLLAEVDAELTRALRRFPRFNSPHEGYAVLYEELDELWDEVRADKEPGARERMRAECVQVAAMALELTEER
jgi:hypothetical protein